MSDQHVITIKESDGKEYKLDISDGTKYDAAGNMVGKWALTDQRHTKALAAYAEDFQFRQAAYAMSLSDKDRAKNMILLHDKGQERPITMDVGVGDVHIPSAMPNFASGYSNEPPVADLAAPVILAQKHTDKYFQFPKEDAFQRATPVVGAPSANVAEISPRPSNTQYATVSHAIGGWVSTEIQANQDAPLNVKMATMDRIMNALLIEREIRVATLMTTSSNWDSGAVATVIAANKWNGGTGADPIADIHARIDASYGKPTAMIMSGRTFRAFQRNPAVRAYFSYKDGTPAVPNAQQMESILQLPKIIVGEMQYIDSSGAKQFIWGNNVVLVRQPRQMPPTDQRDVASAYTFRWNLAQNEIPNGGGSVSVAGGWIVREFFVQDRGELGGTKLVVVHFDAEKMTSVYAGGLVVNAYQ